MEKKKNVPVLRFPEFSGEWEKRKLGELTKLSWGRNTFYK
jgi:type I restriction enzyme S subunit